METTLSHIYSLVYWRELLIPQGFEKPSYCRYHIAGGYFSFKKSEINFCIDSSENTEGYFNHLKIFYGNILTCDITLPDDNGKISFLEDQTSIELHQLLKAIKNSDLLPTCLNISWASPLLEYLIRDWTKTS